MFTRCPISAAIFLIVLVSIVSCAISPVLADVNMWMSQSVYALGDTIIVYWDWTCGMNGGEKLTFVGPYTVTSPTLICSNEKYVAGVAEPRDVGDWVVYGEFTYCSDVLPIQCSTLHGQTSFRVEGSPPQVCTEGAVNVLEMCPDGSTWSHRQVCRNNAWHDEYQQCATGLADLTVLDCGVTPNNPDPTQPATLYADIKNIGTADANNFLWELYLDSFGGNAFDWGRTSLAAGASTRISESLTLGQAGPHSLKWVLNSDHLVTESEYDNNQATCTIVATVGQQTTSFDFAISVDPHYGSVDPGEIARFAVDVSVRSGNPETVYLTAIGGGGYPAFFLERSSGVPPFTTDLIVTTTSSTLSGTYTFTVQASAGSNSKSTSATLEVKPPPEVVQNPDLHVETSTTPQPAIRGQIMEVNIRLTNVGAASAKDVQFSIDISGIPEMYVEGGNLRWTWNDIPPGSNVEASGELKAKENTGGGSISIPILVTYKNEQGTEKKSNSFLDIKIDPNDQVSADFGSKKQHTVTYDSKVFPGQDFRLDFTIRWEESGIVTVKVTGTRPNKYWIWGSYISPLPGGSSIEVHPSGYVWAEPTKSWITMHVDDDTPAGTYYIKLEYCSEKSWNDLFARRQRFELPVQVIGKTSGATSPHAGPQGVGGSPAASLTIRELPPELPSYCFLCVLMLPISRLAPFSSQKPSSSCVSSEAIG